MTDSSEGYDKIASANLSRSNDSSDGRDEAGAAAPTRGKDSTGKHDEIAAANLNRSHDYSEDDDAETYDRATAANLARNKATGQSPGEIMREARRANDYTVEDLCAQTKLSRKTVHALEDNDFQALSQPVFARGYYRQCAKVLDIDSDRLMAAYAAWGGESAPRSAAPGGVAVVPEDVTPRRWRAFGLIGFVLVLLVAAGAVFVLIPDAGRSNDNAGNDPAVLSGSDSSQPSDTNTSGNSATAGNSQGAKPGTNQSAGQSTDQTSSPGSEGGSRNGNNPGSGTSAADMNNKPGIGEGNAGAERADQVGSATGDTGGDAAAAPGASSRPRGGRNVNDALGRNSDDAAAGAQPAAAEPAEPAIAPNHLTLTFNNRSWVDVRDAEGARLLTGIYESGEKREFDAQPPYKITLGRAIAVDIRIGGEPVDMASRTASNGTARLTVDKRGG